MNPITTILMLSMINQPHLAHTIAVDMLIGTMIAQESSNNDMAIGDGGRARGPLQIWRAYWQDACEYGGVSDDPAWRYETEAHNRVKSIQAVRWYWQRYCRAAYRHADLQTLARVHNGGPRGDRKEATLTYWNAVSERMRHRDLL